MVLCLLPSVAFAKDMSWTWTVTIIGGKYCNDDGTEFSINRYKINKYSCISLAVLAISEAKLSFLEAIEAQEEYDELYKN